MILFTLLTLFKKGINAQCWHFKNKSPILFFDSLIKQKL